MFVLVDLAFFVDAKCLPAVAVSQTPRTQGSAPGRGARTARLLPARPALQVPTPVTVPMVALCSAAISACSADETCRVLSCRWGGPCPEHPPLPGGAPCSPACRPDSLRESAGGRLVLDPCLSPAPGTGLPRKL